MVKRNPSPEEIAWQDIRERFKLSRLAEARGITRGAIGQWTKVPPEHAIGVEAFTGISRHVLREDIFGPEPEKAAE